MSGGERRPAQGLQAAFLRSCPFQNSPAQPLPVSSRMRRPRVRTRGRTHSSHWGREVGIKERALGAETLGWLGLARGWKLTGTGVSSNRTQDRASTFHVALALGLHSAHAHAHTRPPSSLRRPPAPGELGPMSAGHLLLAAGAGAAAAGRSHQGNPRTRHSPRSRSATNQSLPSFARDMGTAHRGIPYPRNSAGVCQSIESRQSQRRSRYCKPCTPPSSTVAGHPDLVPVSSLAPELGLAGSGQAQDCRPSIHPSAPFRDEHPPVDMWNPTTTLMIEAWVVPRPGRH